MKIIAVIPAYNEEKNIADVIKKAKKYAGEIIVVNDGSSDSTAEAAKSADFVLNHIVNAGKGIALKTGFEAALKRGASIIITLDADGQHDPADIPRLLDVLKKEKADIVIGARKINKSMPFIFKIGNWFINSVFKFLFKEDLEDTQSGYRAVRADVYPKIKWTNSNYAVETEMLAKAGKHGLVCREITIETKYSDKYKGTTVFDGINIFFKMLIWKLRRD